MPTRRTKMTRINVVPAEELTTTMLLAEYRELPRIFNLVRRAQERGETPAMVGIPSEYTLGKSHLKFFYDKLRFLVDREKTLILELELRGLSPKFTDPENLLSGIHPHWVNDWAVTPTALYFNRLRLRERHKPHHGFGRDDRG